MSNYQASATNFCHNSKEELYKNNFYTQKISKSPSKLASTIVETASEYQFNNKVRGHLNHNYDLKTDNSQFQNHQFNQKLNSSSPQKKTVNKRKHTSLQPKFIQRCQEKLAHYIGPIAILIVEDVLRVNTNLKPYEFVEFLSREIPDFKEANKFIQDFISVVK